MLSFPSTKVFQSIERPVAAGSSITAEGKALIGATVGGVFGAKMSAGSAGEVFLGVSINMLNIPVDAPYQESLTQGAGNTITLTYTPTASSLLLVDSNTSTVQTVGNPGTTANQYSISGQVITLNAAQTGHAYLAQYRFNLTVAQWVALWGNVHPGGPAGAYLGQTGIIQKGDVYTSEYDTAVDWTGNNLAVKLGANGIFTTAGSGVTLTNVTVIAPPQAGLGYLGLEIR